MDESVLMEIRDRFDSVEAKLRETLGHVVSLTETLEEYRPHLEKLERAANSKIVRVFSGRQPIGVDPQSAAPARAPTLPAPVAAPSVAGEGPAALPESQEVTVPRAIPVLRPGV